MKCKELKKLLEYRNSIHKSEIAAHAEQCEGCRRYLVLESLTSALVKAHGSNYEFSENLGADSGKDLGGNPYLMTRIRVRIRELGEQSVNSWESAVLALRGWVIVFGAAAVLLLVISARWQLQNMGNATDHDIEMSTISNIDDYLSGNINAPGAFPENLNSIDEAARDAHK